MTELTNRIFNTIRNLYYPSINYREFKKYNKIYYKNFGSYPNEISILMVIGFAYILFVEKKNIYNYLLFYFLFCNCNLFKKFAEKSKKLFIKKNNF